jgi:hypothetical protein
MAPDERPVRADDLTYYQQLRSRLEHEDGLIVSRLAWLMASESFLFTAYAIVLNAAAATPQHRRLMHLIPIVAIASSVLIFIGIVAAVRAMGWIRGLLQERLPDPAALGLPPIHTPGSVRAGLTAPLVLPVMFVVVWLYLLATGE